MPGLEDEEVPADQAAEEFGEPGRAEVFRPRVGAFRNGKATSRGEVGFDPDGRRSGGYRGSGTDKATPEEHTHPCPEGRRRTTDRGTEDARVAAPLASHVRADVVGESLLETLALSSDPQGTGYHVPTHGPVGDGG